MKILQKPDEFYLDLLETLLLPDCVSRSSYFQSQSKKDWTTILRRSLFEGFQFLTKTLPKLGKALDQGLLEGQFSCPREFKTLKGCKIPAFLQGFFQLIFNCESGKLLPDPAIWAIKHIRQLCYWYYKLELPYSEKDEKKVLTSFVQTDAEVGQYELDSNLDVKIASDMTGGTMFNSTAVNIFGNFNPKDIMPKHGPGAVATGERGEEKWTFKRLYLPIHNQYSYWQYTILPGMYDSNDPLEESGLEVIPTGGIAKVHLVPKDSRGPRLISAEPLEYMWFQQGLGAAIVWHLEKACRLTRGQINFTSQSFNQALSLISSTEKGRSSLSGNLEKMATSVLRRDYNSVVRGKYATLDLKDASDRVSLALVERIFSKCPELLNCLRALRSTATILPSGEKIQLAKYAPMGSALCFPVEAYCFWILIVAAISRNDTRPPYKIMKDVFVYGDDIIVPQKYALLAIQTLESVGLKVNVSKSCITGSFRESCGVDAFMGVDITSLKCRTRWTGKATDHEALVSYVSYANRLRRIGYDEAYRFLVQKIEKLYGAIPWGTETSGYICWWAESWEVANSINRVLFPSKYSPRYHAFMFRFRHITTKLLESTLDGWRRLLRNLTVGTGDRPSVYSLPRSSIIKRRWIVAS